jgi:hypothetical protein
MKGGKKELLLETESRQENWILGPLVQGRTLLMRYR